MEGVASRSKNLWWPAFFAIGGMLLSTALLLGITGGFIVVLLAFLLIVPGMAILAIAHTFQQRQEVAAAGKTQPVATPQIEIKPPTVPVVARVIEAGGLCPLGYQFRIGDIYTLNGEASGLAHGCPVAGKALREAREHLRRAEERGVQKVVCRSGHHRVVFELVHYGTNGKK